MKTLMSLIKRNIKLFFKDFGMFFTALVTPMILLVLYATFLSNVYKDSFLMSLGQYGEAIEESLIDGFVGAQLFSSLLAVSCITVAFCSNMLMVQDKVSGSRADLTVSPVKSSVLSLSYYAATVVSTLIISIVATGACFVYVASVGWYLSVADVFLILLDVLILVLFGTALSSVVHFFLSTQGQITAVGTIISAGYGFICGAYMPISSFSEGLQKVVAFLPGTYGTSLLRNHTMRGTFEEMSAIGLPDEAIEILKDTVDCNIYFFEKAVDIPIMYAILCTSTLLLMAVYVILNIIKKR